LRRGQVILILLGLALLAFFYFSPVVPTQNNKNSEEVVTEEIPEISGEMTPDQRINQALLELQDSTIPPMQTIMKIAKVAEEHPENQKAQLTLGLLSLQTGQFENATVRFSNLVSLDSSNGESWKYLAQARLGAGDTVEARKVFEKALQLVDAKMEVAFRAELPALVRN